MSRERRDLACAVAGTRPTNRAAGNSTGSDEAGVKRARPFLVLWTLAVAAATAAFVLHLGLRVRAVELGYELGRAHARVARLREVKRVLELELASHKTPERVDLVARTLLGMSEPTPDRIIPAGAQPQSEPPEQQQGAPGVEQTSGGEP
jgi:cell division protein FtsL